MPRTARPPRRRPAGAGCARWTPSSSTSPRRRSSVAARSWSCDSRPACWPPQSARDRFVALVGQVPPGNALCVTDLTASGARGPAAKGVLRDAVAAAGGVVAEFQVLPAGRLEAWLMERAAELGANLEPSAARLLAVRVGGHVRESDVDRRRRTELANAELEKLALYRPGGSIGAADVEALVERIDPRLHLGLPRRDRRPGGSAGHAARRASPRGRHAPARAHLATAPATARPAAGPRAPRCRHDATADREGS